MNSGYLAVPMLFGLWWKADDWLAREARRDKLGGWIEWTARVMCCWMFFMFEMLAFCLAR